MKAEYIQKGDSLDYKNETETAIEAGDVVVFGNRIGIAGTVIPSGRTGAIQMVGVFRLPKKEGEEIAAGAAVYYGASGITAVTVAEASALAEGGKAGKAAAGEAMTADSAPPVPAGYAVGTAAADSGYVTVKLVG